MSKLCNDKDHGCRLKKKGNAIYGTFLGINDEGLVIFLDEETYKVYKYKQDEVEKTYERGI